MRPRRFFTSHEAWSTGAKDPAAFRFPFQGQITVPAARQLAVGKHRLRVVVQGDRWPYLHWRKESFRRLRGTIASNVVELEVVE